MDFIRTARNPWGEDILVGLAWDVLWLIVIAGALFIVVHALFAKKKNVAPHSIDPAVSASVPDKIERHSKSARISHWILALATFALLITAFVPILGLQFPWVTIHWIAGIVLAAYVVYHTIDTLARKSWPDMWLGMREIGESVGRVRGFFQRKEDPEARQGKWGTPNKVFHQITALAGLGVVGTGILMMARVDTWFWQANPYIFGLSDGTWGWIFFLHGLAAVGFVGLLMAHIYFAVRPDKFYLTKSMVVGWITRTDYLEHYNPKMWPVSGGGESVRTGGDSGGGTAAGSASATSARTGAE